MALKTFFLKLLFILLVSAKTVKKDNVEKKEEQKDIVYIDDVFNGVYTECFVTFSFPCVQRKTLMYLKQLNKLSEVSVVGDYVKFVKLNTSQEEFNDTEDDTNTNTEELSQMIDQAIDKFFDDHVIKLSALGKDVSIPNKVEEFVGRKKRKGGGMMSGEGVHFGHEGGHFGHKKMMIMAMMCMKMKMMMMLPAMMGMMGMMSFKGMMFSMMSFIVSKMMLLMKILEKKGVGGSGGGSGGGDGGWAAAGGGGGAWMPAGGQDFGGGGYDANGQWQSRSIFENKEDIKDIKEPIISYIPPVVTYNNPNKYYKTINDVNKKGVKSRKKRSLIDVLQNSYIYWMNKLLGMNNNRRTSNFPKYKIVNGVKYVYYPFRQQKYKTPKEIQNNKINPMILTAEDFNKGEIVEGAVENRMNKEEFMKIKDAVNETLDDNPWE